MEVFLRNQVSSLVSNESSKGRDDEVVAVLRFSRTRVRAVWAFMLVILAFFFTLALVAGLEMPLEPRNDLWERMSALILVMCLCGLGPWLLLVEPVGSARVITKRGILKQSPWTGTSFVPWDGIESIRWIPILDNFFVRSNIGTFAVSPVCENLDKFAQGVIFHVPRSKWTRAEKKLTKALAGPFQP